MTEKKNYIELKTFDDFVKTFPFNMVLDEQSKKNTKFLMKEIKKPRCDGKTGKFYLLRIYCPFCEDYAFLHTAIFEMDGEIKEHFDKDEPLRMMCPKCNGRATQLISIGTNPEVLSKSFLST